MGSAPSWPGAFQRRKQGGANGGHRDLRERRNRTGAADFGETTAATPKPAGAAFDFDTLPPQLFR